MQFYIPFLAALVGSAYTQNDDCDYWKAVCQDSQTQWLQKQGLTCTTCQSCADEMKKKFCNSDYYDMKIWGCVPQTELLKGFECCHTNDVNAGSSDCIHPIPDDYDREKCLQRHGW
jgi:hypothetical protein